jgi:hypothetical protein
MTALFIITEYCHNQGLQVCLVIAKLHFPVILSLPGKSAGQSAGPVCRASLPGQSAGPVCQASLPGKSARPVCQASLPGKSAGPVCQSSLPGQSAGLVCWASRPGKSARQVCRASLPGKSAGQVCRASLPGKSAGQVCRASLPGKSDHVWSCLITSDHVWSPPQQQQQSKKYTRRYTYMYSRVKMPWIWQHLLVLFGFLPKTFKVLASIVGPRTRHLDLFWFFPVSWFEWFLNKREIQTERNTVRIRELTNLHH